MARCSLKVLILESQLTVSIITKPTTLIHLFLNPNAGSGRTNCLGKYLTYQEMGILLSRMLWLFDMRLELGLTLGERYVTLGNGRTRKTEFEK